MKNNGLEVFHTKCNVCMLLELLLHSKHVLIVDFFFLLHDCENVVMLKQGFPTNDQNDQLKMSHTYTNIENTNTY